MAMMMAVGVVGISYIVSTNSKNNTVIKNKNVADRDLEDATMRIGAILITPAHCNANLKGKAFDKSQTPINNSLSGSIKTCPSGSSCFTAPGSYGADSIPIIPDIPANADKWKTSDTGLTERVRIVKVQYFLRDDQKAQVYGPITNLKAGVMNVRVTFQKNLGFANNVRTTANIVRDFDAFVVSHVFDSSAPHVTPFLTLLTNVSGCAWTPNSTNVYK